MIIPKYFKLNIPKKQHHNFSISNNKIFYKITNYKHNILNSFIHHKYHQNININIKYIKQYDMIDIKNNEYIPSIKNYTSMTIDGHKIINEKSKYIMLTGSFILIYLFYKLYENRNNNGPNNPFIHILILILIILLATNGPRL